MCKLRTLALTCFFIVCTFKGLFSQITISSTSGCLPNGITNAIFTYVGSGSPTGIVWDFGDGSPTSNQNPTQHSYPNLGTYTVTFSATIGGNTVTYTSTVVVNPQPTGAFTTTVPSVHCLPMSVGFTGTSPMSNVIYKWDFGDGNIAQGNPNGHTYVSQGIYNPILTVQNTVTGCFINIPGNAINVSSLPNINVNVSPGITTCASSLNASFTGSSSTTGSPLGGGLSFAWNFGAFGSSGVQTPAPVLFQPQGIYPITLTVTDNNSCSNTTVIPVTLLSPSLNVTVPATVCLASQQTGLYAPFFTVTVESNIQSTTWDMDNGSPIFGFPLPQPPNNNVPLLLPNTPYTNTIFPYTTPGLKTLTITATTGTCVAVAIRTIMVEEIVPNFAAVPANYTCSPSFTVAYVNTTTVNTANALTYTWTTDHWTKLPIYAYTSTAVNPTITVTQTHPNPYIVWGPYYPKSNLFVQSAIGCTAYVQQNFDTIWRPTASFITSKKEGCGPLTVTLTNNSYYDNLINPLTGGSMNPITNYTWNAGDGINTAAGTGSNIPDQTFTYSSPGTYTPFLTIQTALGCPDVSFVDTIIVVNPPTISYTLPVGSLCAGQQVTVNLTAAPSETVQHWHVESDAGYFSGCVTEKNPVWKMNHIGVHSFSLSGYARSCANSLVPPQTVTVTGPDARFRYETQCVGNKKTVKFNCYLNDATGGYLDFGDGTAPVDIAASSGAITSTVLSNTYPATGDYVAIITATSSNGCAPRTYSQVVKVREIHADFFIVDDVICKSADSLKINATASQDVYTNCSTGYSWQFDDDVVLPTKYPVLSLSSTYDNSVGTHVVKLRVKDENGCTDEMAKTYRVSHPVPNFTFNHNPICMSDMPLQMINTAAHSPDSIKLFRYEMGNAAFNGLNYDAVFTNSATPSHTYSPTYTYTMGSTQSKTFVVTQVVTNTEGCVDSVKKTLTVSNPQITFGAFKPAACVGEALVFGIIAANTHTNYNIYFGDSLAFNTTAYNSPTMYYRAHKYLLPGVFTPTATLTDNAGCTVTLSIPSVTIEPYPVASFTLCNYINGSTGSDFCMPFTSSLTSTSQYGGVGNLMYYWDLGKGDPTTITQSSVAGTTFTNTGNYTASLTVMSPYASCAASTYFTFHLFDPHIDFVIVPDSTKQHFCLGEPITVSVSTTSGSQYFIWDFGDGVVRPKTYLPAPGPLLTSVYSNTYFPVQTNGDLTIEITGYAGSVTTGTVTTAACKEAKRKKVNVIQVLGDFKRNDEIDITDYRHCLGEPDKLEALSTSNSPGTLTYTWNYGDATSGYINPSGHLYNAAGIYTTALTGGYRNPKLILNQSRKLLFGPRSSRKRPEPLWSQAVGVGISRNPEPLPSMKGSDVGS